MPAAGNTFFFLFADFRGANKIKASIGSRSLGVKKECPCIHTLKDVTTTPIDATCMCMTTHRHIDQTITTTGYVRTAGARDLTRIYTYAYVFIVSAI